MSEQPQVDWSPLAQFWELMEDDGEAVEDLVQTFLGDTPQLLSKLDAAHASGDVSAVGTTAHTLKGSSGTIGAMRFSKLCEVIEHAAKKGDELDYGAQIEAVRAEYRELEGLLPRWREHLSPPA